MVDEKLPCGCDAEGHSLGCRVYAQRSDEPCDGAPPEGVFLDAWGFAWGRDPASSGWRTRAFPPGAEILVYDDGQWFVRLNESPVVNAGGTEPTASQAQQRALRVYSTLREALQP